MRRNRKGLRPNKKNSGAPKWMVTYSDMITLILVFFILLFSMSNIDDDKFDAVTDSFRNRMIFDFYPSSVPLEEGSGNIVEGQSGKDTGLNREPVDNLRVSRDVDTKKIQDALRKEDELNKLMKDVQSFLVENDLTDAVSASRTERGVELILQDSILFDSGEADILTSGEPFLDRIGELLSAIPNYVRVEGHTDDRPISSYRYPSNWELSSARGASVIRYLTEEKNLEQYRFSSVGYGETRPVTENDNKNNWHKNRRVEIVILEDENSSEEEK